MKTCDLIRLWIFFSGCQLIDDITFCALFFHVKPPFSQPTRIISNFIKPRKFIRSQSERGKIAGGQSRVDQICVRIEYCSREIQDWTLRYVKWLGSRKLSENAYRRRIVWKVFHRIFIINTHTYNFTTADYYAFRLKWKLSKITLAQNAFGARP